MKKINVTKALKLWDEFAKASRDLEIEKSCFENVKARAERNGQTLRDETIKSYTDKITKAEGEVEKALAEFTEQKIVVAAALDDVQKKASTRTLEAGEILATVEKIGHYLGIPKNSLDGTKVVWCPCGGNRVPNAYKYPYVGTIITFENIKGTWYIVEIERDDCKKIHHEFKFILSDLAKEKYIEKMCNPDRI